MNLSTSSFVLGAVIASLYGALFHLWRGGRYGRLLLYLFLAWIGFWAGHFLGTYLNIDIGKIGSLHFGFATAFSVLFLFVGHWLSPVRAKEE